MYTNIFFQLYCYDEEVQKFLQMQYYDSEIGNAMPLAMARALGVPLVILTSIVGCPLIHVTPPHCESSAPLFLAYIQCGGGHYDMAEFIGDGKAHLDSISCRCRVNRKKDVQACADSKRYKSRCKCFKNKSSCTIACLCKGCKNPFGERPSRPVQRKRQRHEF